MTIGARAPLLLIAATMLGGLLVRAAGPKQVIAHRGASSYAPEHTRAAYQLAIDQGADFVEQDLAVTRDGVLVCLHDDTLDRTSNAAAIFPARASQFTENGRTRTGRLANDFTLAELRQLDMGTWFNPTFAGQRIVTWQEAIDLVRGKAGLYPELKSPPLYTARGIDMVKLFVESVKKNGLDRPESLRTTPMIVQSFDEPTIRRVAAELPDVPRILLMDSLGPDGLSDARLRELKTFASGIGPRKQILDADPGLVKRAQAAGLTVTAYTFRSGSTGRFASVREEMSHFLHTLGIDAVFTDNPDQFPRDAPRVRFLEKPPHDLEIVDAFVHARPEEAAVGAPRPSRFPSGTPKLTLDIRVKELKRLGTTIRFEIASSHGPVAMADGLFAFAKLQHEGVSSMELDLVPAHGPFADGAYELTVFMNDIPVAVLNWTVGDQDSRF